MTSFHYEHSKRRKREKVSRFFILSLPRKIVIDSIFRFCDQRYLLRKKLTAREMSQNDDTTTISLSDYILERLIQLRVKSIFSVPGDFNLTFLDHIEDSKHLQLIGCANEVSSAF